MSAPTPRPQPRLLESQATTDPPPLPPKPGMPREPVEQLSHQVQAMALPQDSAPYYPTSNAHPQPPLNSHPPPSYSATAGEGTFSTQRKKDDEIHLLRMTVHDKEAMIKKLDRDKSFCHDELRRLNQLLAEKKESVLKYHEKISDLQSEVTALKQENAALRQRSSNPLDPHSGSLHDSALQSQVQQLRQQLNDVQWRNEKLMAENQQLQQHRDSSQPPLPPPSHPPPRNSPVLLEEVQSLQKQVEFYKGDRTGLLQEISALKSRVEVLNHQVMTYNEDFLTERSDRERAHSRIQSLKEENESLHQAISLLAQEHGIRLDAYGLGPPRN